MTPPILAAFILVLTTIHTPMEDLNGKVLSKDDLELINYLKENQKEIEEYLHAMLMCNVRSKCLYLVEKYKDIPLEDFE